MSDDSDRLKRFLIKLSEDTALLSEYKNNHEEVMRREGLSESEIAAVKSGDLEKTKNEVGKFFKKNQLTYLWCWCIQCPHCKQRIPLTNQMYIAKTAKKKIGIKIIPKNKDFTVEINHDMTETEGKKFTQKHGKAICISCTNSIDYKTLTEDISKNKDREMIAHWKKKLNDGYDLTIYDFDGPRTKKGDILCLELTKELLIEKINDTRFPFGHGYIVAATIAGINPDIYIE